MLSCLALVSVLAVSFSSITRTGRLAGHAALEYERAYHLLETALADAWTAIDTHMTAGEIYFPDFELWVSGGAGDARLGMAPEMDHVPEILPYPGPAGWTPQYAGGELVGQTAWAAYDCSGCLDLNAVHRRPRASGRFAGEIRLPSGKARDRLLEARAFPWRRFESTAEVRAALDGARAWDWPAAPYLAAFSLFPTNGCYASCAAVLDQRRTPRTRTPERSRCAAWLAADDGEAQVRRAFRAMLERGRPRPGLDLDLAADLLARQLVHYQLDAVRALPPQPMDEALSSPGEKAWLFAPVFHRPMLNELVFRSRCIASNGPSVCRLTIEIELHYPFERDYTGCYEPAGGDPPPLRAELQLYTEGGTTDPCSVSTPLRTAAGAFEGWGSGRPCVTASLPLELGSTDGFSGDRTLVIDRLLLLQGDGIVDAAFGALAGRHAARLACPLHSLVATEPGTEKTVAYQARDPRLNWDLSRQWKRTEGRHTLGRVHETPGTHADRSMSFKPSFRCGPGDVRGPVMESAAEIGGFVYDPERPWHTVPLIGTGAFPVFEYFRVVPPEETGTTEPARGRGRVHACTPYPEVFAAALREATFGGVAGCSYHPSRDRWSYEYPLQVDEQTAGRIAEAWVAAGTSGSASNLFGRLRAFEYEDLYRATGVHSKRAADTLTGRFARLISVRQNLFTILAAARSVRDIDRDNEVDEDEITAAERGVYVIWRDPRPDANGRHPLKVLLRQRH
ncbi:hypothetical protein [Kiritimatiella glycovorans]|uniref:Uncharacterized protein n=1 Tax=Kiritimatiella glycovorans TaxID=1307763 RepID=A0A0G3EF24_9BACT|nr:hypothetical protein [Kiritimatiella glycovorans]AKJ64032.1 hypothetical protein L21SP4_00767 [Kiritimatiella glycovorans]